MNKDKIKDNNNKSPDIGSDKDEESSTDSGNTKASTEQKDLQKKYDETYDALLRAKAEIENIKKRNQKEVESIYKYSNESLILEILPIYDSLELSLKTSDNSKSYEKIKEGNELLLSMFKKFFKSNNLIEINPLNDKFNPDYHQAISTKADKKKKDNDIIEVIQKGYMLNTRVIKPALVIVVKNT